MLGADEAEREWAEDAEELGDRRVRVLGPQDEDLAMGRIVTFLQATLLDTKDQL